MDLAAFGASFITKTPNDTDSRNVKHEEMNDGDCDVREAARKGMIANSKI